MGKLIIKYESGKVDSFKCKSIKRACQIVSKRVNIAWWDFIENGKKLKPSRTPKKEISKLSPYETRQKLQENIAASTLKARFPWNL